MKEFGSPANGEWYQEEEDLPENKWYKEEDVIDDVATGGKNPQAKTSKAGNKRKNENMKKKEDEVLRTMRYLEKSGSDWLNKMTTQVFLPDAEDFEFAKKQAVQFSIANHGEEPPDPGPTGSRGIEPRGMVSPCSQIDDVVVRQGKDDEARMGKGSQIQSSKMGNDE
ncbi:hypothetical protein RIF29_15945 [Crotalaria pallida]|uniref:Uncharacterized protein n=1 Tax=Crotalaria pallida TaxID=3830 RepID=A0AAN9FHZ6_CROPI